MMDKNKRGEEQMKEFIGDFLYYTTIVLAGVGLVALLSDGRVHDQAMRSLAELSLMAITFASSCYASNYLLPIVSDWYLRRQSRKD